MHDKQLKLLNSLNQYDLTQIIHNYSIETINTTFQGQPILTLFAKDCLNKIHNHKLSYLTKFIGIYQKLVELGANPNLIDENTGKTSLHEIIAYGTNSFNELIFKKVLEHSNINKKDYQELSSLDYAIQYDNNIALEIILNSSSLHIDEKNILNCVKYCHNYETLSKFLSLQDIKYSKIKSSLEHNNLLHVALINSNNVALPLLIELNIHPLEKNREGKTPYDYVIDTVDSPPILKKYIDYFILKEQLSHNAHKEKIKKI